MCICTFALEMQRIKTIVANKLGCCYVSLQKISPTSVLASSKNKGINTHQTPENLVILMVSFCDIRQHKILKALLTKSVVPTTSEHVEISAHFQEK